MTANTLDPIQQVVLKAYDGGIRDGDIHNEAEIDDCGDTLLTFLLRELSIKEDCVDFQEAERRLMTVRSQIEGVFAAVVNAQEENSNPPQRQR